jgi:hypothetical protein
MVFGLSSNSAPTGFQLVQFDTSILSSLYEARLMQRSLASTTSITSPAPRSAAVETPWGDGGDDRSLERRVNEVRNIAKFIDERSPEAQLAGDDRDAKALFTLYRALEKMRAIAEYAAEANVTASSRRSLEPLLAQALGEVNNYTANVDLDKLDLLYGTKSNRVETEVKLGRNDSKVIGSVIQTGSRTDPIPGLTGTESFTVTIAKSGETQDFQIDLSAIAGPVSLQSLVEHVNSRVSAVQATDTNGDPIFDDQGNPVAKYQTRFNVEDMGDAGFALAVSGLTIEEVSLSAMAAEPSLFLAGTNRAIGNDAMTSATLTRLDGIDGTDPSRAFRDSYSASGAPILEVPEEKDEDLTSGRTNEVIESLKKQVSDLFTDLEINKEEDPFSRPPEETSASAVAVDSQGHVFVVGTTEGDIDNQLNRSDGGDVYLSKYDASGNLIWQRMLGASGTAEGYAVAVDSQDNVIVAGRVDGTLDGSELYDGSDSAVVKFDNSGDRLWTRQMDSLAEDGALALTVDANDDVYLSGYVSGVIANGESHGGGRDAYVARLTGGDGAVAAATQFGGNGQETAKAITVASDGNILVASEEDGRAILRKLDQTDLTNQLWSVDLGDLQGGKVSGIAVEGGAVYVAGYSGSGAMAGTSATAHQGGQDGFVTRIDDAGMSGSAAWTSYVGSGTGDFIEDVVVNAGTVYVAGRTSGELDGAAKSGVTDAFAAKINGADGSHHWVEQIGGAAGFNGASGLAFSSSGNSVLTSLGLGPGTLQPRQTRDVESQTTLRPGDHFYISINDGAKRKITIQEGDTFNKIASRINRLSFQYIKAETTFSSDGNGLKIAVKNGSSIEIFAGSEGEDALVPLGLSPTKILPTDKIFKLSEDEDQDDTLGGVFGLKFEAGLSLTTENAAKYTLGRINDAIAEVQRAYRSLSVNPLAELLKQQAKMESGTVPPALRAQLANYQAGLSRLMAGGGGGFSI